MKAQSARIHGLDTLRSLAILGVIVFHLRGYGAAGTLPDWLLPIAQFGWMGVDLFFVLSGYLIGSQLLRPYRKGERASVWQFYRNRFYRILPAYLTVLALYLLIPAWREELHLAPLWEFFTFTLNLFINYPYAAAFSHAWSLCVEEHFYLILPLLVLVMMRRPSLRKTVVVIACLVSFGVAVRAFILFHWLQPMSRADGPTGLFYLTHIYYPTYSRLDGLIAGVTLALIRSFRPRWWQALAQRGNAATLAGMAFVAMAVWLSIDRFESFTGRGAWGTVFAYPVLAVGFAFLTASAMSANGLLSRIKMPGAELIATLAYSLYLTQKEMIHLTDEWFPGLANYGRWAWLAAYALCCLAVAGALHLCVERPFLLLRDRKRGPDPATEAASDPLPQ
ncbi:MAG: acyltransferase family protein [Acidobacteriota bacterium]